MKRTRFPAPMPKDGAAVGNQRELEDVGSDDDGVVIRDLVAGLAGAQDLVAIDDYGRAGDSHERHALGGKVHREARTVTMMRTAHARPERQVAGEGFTPTASVN